ncbi:D-alanyl-D-alanine dipeptidase [Limobrevibacterium gyesilva]|uniref:D-alanyl-D-alanine dipeptidase n=1 Tax=Limobrevibacterium gyesilva TaxID=2991712 RepID=A0AA42CDB1_9PROT|nr:D-alanyl-D-alanine dipeptidase [Limobrevibacterium gyesilva]MCW3474633.1 D-alanyl-D-alanine dipeptidase [Limobrevibacterium gyesilva]
MLVTLTAADGLLFDIRYATSDNLTGRPIYTRPVAMLLPEARDRLRHAGRLAAQLGLRLKVYDAFRPIEAQWALWHAVTDKRFVADPRAGGVHPRGAAVDLTLVDSNGDELPMGAGFDEIAARSAHGVADIPADAQRNRALLLGLMTAAGWDHYRLEWWHYQLHTARNHPPLNATAVPGGPM